MEQYIFNEKEDVTFLIIKGNNFPMVHLKGDQYSFPLHNDLTISDRDSNLFFNKMNQSEQMVNVFIVSRRIPKSIIDYVKEKCTEKFTNFNIHPFEYGDILSDIIELDITNMVIKDSHGLNFQFYKDNWIEIKYLNIKDYI